MATSIAHLCEKNGYDPHEALGTSLLTLAISTFIVGVLIVLVGACRHPLCDNTLPLGPSTTDLFWCLWAG